IAQEIAEATAFVLLVGEKGLGPWQEKEYYEALNREKEQPEFPIVPVMLKGQAAPDLPLLRQRHWIITEDLASDGTIGQIMEASPRHGTQRKALWRYTAPYRGLPAMTQADSDFFFGRTRETIEVISAMEAAPDKLPVLLGN